jgi:hypothetical protein
LEGSQSDIGDRAIEVLPHTPDKIFLPQDSQSDTLSISFLIPYG